MGQLPLIFSVVVTFILVANLTNGQKQSIDRECGDDLSHLWLDVVVVIENTAGMTAKGLAGATSNAQTVFLQSQIGSHYSDPRSTRVSFVTYGKSATVVADLNKLQSIDDLLNLKIPFNNEDEPHVVTGLLAAENVFADGRANGYRSNYKKLIILYASSYEGKGEHDPVPVAKRIIDSGTYIATVAFSQQGDDESLENIGQLATPHFNFTSEKPNLDSLLQGAALQANCYCPDLWVQYRADINDIYSRKHGVCLFAHDQASTQVAAKFSCQNSIRNGYLATEFSSDKHQYLHSLVQATPTIKPPYAYFNGLFYVNGGWHWLQPAGESLIPMNQTDIFWNHGNPVKPFTTNSAVLNQESGSSFGWVNTNPFKTSKNYICEVRSCDTENYCKQ